MTTDTTERIRAILSQQVLVLDGAMGTMIQKLDLTEADFRGSLLPGHPQRVSGFNDLLSLTLPEAITAIHEAYLRAGADIVTTNTFNSNPVSMAEYGLDSLEGLTEEINRAAVRAARTAAARHTRPWGLPLVAGSVGPTGKTASMSPVVSDPSLRDIDFDTLAAAYSRQITALLREGVDLLLFETVFDTLNLKAGIDAAREAMEATGRRVPVMVSATLTDKAGRTLSGQTLSAFATSAAALPNVFSLGLNCSFGPAELLPHLRELSEVSEHFVSCHPNAGLPNALGEYDVTPEDFAARTGKMLDEGLLNIIGGCCGTTPAHIAAIAPLARRAVARKPVGRTPALRISGLEETEIAEGHPFVNIGERCNVAGSRRFLRLIKEKDYAAATAVARRQVEDGAMAIDINMDDPLLDAPAELETFIRHIAAEPEIARVPTVVDSSDWNAVERALKNLQGKSIVNSISLKEGEEAFKAKARRIRQLGAAAIVMAFDERGQADTFERKIEICRRAYGLLTRDCGFDPADIIFDVNVMAVATGMAEHRRYGIDFIDAVRWVKENLPGARTSGGISNLSFAFRGKDALREAMHAVFLFHAIGAGLDMGIVNAASTVTYNDIDPALRSLIEDVVLDRRDGACDELAELASSMVTDNRAREKQTPPRDLSLTPSARLAQAVAKGQTEFIADDIDELIAEGTAPAEIIEGPLMGAMNRVGDLFGQGKMFLPQVVKAARTMKAAVDRLKPMMESAAGSQAAPSGKVVFATVKGDVHDIGKNIASIVLACNNFQVIDLGVMVPPEQIVETVLKEKADIVCLSGLITPSLTEMANTARALRDAGVDVPLFVGGAATGELHTALRIAPFYKGPVVRMADASQNPLMAARLLNPDTRDECLRTVQAAQEKARKEFTEANTVPLVRARANRLRLDFNAGTVARPAADLGKAYGFSIPLAEAMPLVNWKMFFHAWRLSGAFLDTFPWDGCDSCRDRWLATLPAAEREKGAEAFRLYADARRVLRNMNDEEGWELSALVAFYRANSKGDDLTVGNVTLPMLRQQKEGECLSVADFVAPEGTEDHAAVFAVTAGQHHEAKVRELHDSGNGYAALLHQTLADRLAEAGAEWLHAKVRNRLWNYAPGEKLTPREMLRGNYRGIRPAMGYPSLPDQLLNLETAKLLPLDSIGVTVTENGAMSPAATVSGLMLAHPGARYFQVGHIGADQTADYARRRGLTEARVHEIMPKTTPQPTTQQ